MVFHDFPWGLNKAPWDVRLTPDEFKTRVAATTHLNSSTNYVSFSLLSFFDFDHLRAAHHHAGFRGGDIVLVIDKTNVVDPTPESHGLITHLNGALVSFLGPQAEITWSFSPDPEGRKQRWATLAVHHKSKGPDGNVINPTEQPVEVDIKAMSHWSEVGDWVFVDGFGSGTTLIAALESGRCAVATEPDRAQFDAAGQRLDRRIEELLHLDAAQMKRKAAREKARAEELALQRKLESTKLKHDQQEKRRKRKEGEEAEKVLSEEPQPAKSKKTKGKTKGKEKKKEGKKEKRTSIPRKKRGAPSSTSSAGVVTKGGKEVVSVDDDIIEDIMLNLVSLVCLSPFLL